MNTTKTDVCIQMEDLRKWAKYGKLLSGVIHNLNTPLMGITGRVELISFKMPDLKGLEQITRQLDAINDILSALAFMVDKDTNVESMVMDLNELIGKVNGFMRADMKYKHRLDVELDLQDTIIVDTIPCYLQNAIIEIIGHSLSLCDDDNTITIQSRLDGNDALVIIQHDGKRIPEVAISSIGTALEDHNQDDPAFNLCLADYYLRKIDARLEVKNTDVGAVYELRIPAKKGKGK